MNPSRRSTVGNADPDVLDKRITLALRDADEWIAWMMAYRAELVALRRPSEGLLAPRLESRGRSPERKPCR